jgi:hypothetical protein
VAVGAIGPPKVDRRPQLLGALPPQQSRRPPIANKSGRRAEDDDLPAFLLPFIAEHVRSAEQTAALEADAAAAATMATGAKPPRRVGPWQRVPPRRGTGGESRKAVRAADVITLHDEAFRCVMRSHFFAKSLCYTVVSDVITVCRPTTIWTA